MAPQALPQIEAALWRELASSVHDKAHGWRLPVLATQGTDGPDARVVVLREVDKDQRTLVMFTDARSPKVQQVQAQPGGVLVMWSQALSWQLRLRVSLTVETSGLRVSSHWAKLAMTPAAQDYLAPLPPGSPLPHKPAPQRESREHFALLAAQVVAIDWLELAPGGHRRALFDEHGARWVTP